MTVVRAAGDPDPAWPRRRRGATALAGDVAPLPTARWSPPTDADAVAEVPVAGVFLGMDRAGRPAALPAVAPRPIRVGMLGASAAATVLAHRLLAVGCQVTVVTAGSPHWRLLHARINSPRLSFVDRPVRWPATRPGPPGTTPGPQALVVDSPMQPPPTSIGDADWCTVVHVAPAMPVGSPFWDTVHALVVTERGHATGVSRRWPRADTAVAEDLRSGEIALADAAGTRAVSLLLTHTEQAVMLATS